jgi:hypothetical protein
LRPPSRPVMLFVFAAMSYTFRDVS